MNANHGWATELLWRAYETLEKNKVRGAEARRLLTDVVSLVRFAFHQEDELVPFQSKVEAKYAAWLASQEMRGVTFTDEQRRWLDDIRDHIAANLAIEMDDFEYVPFALKGGAGRVYQQFGEKLPGLREELNEVLAA